MSVKGTEKPLVNTVLGRYLQAERIKRGYSQREAARLMGMAPTWLSNLENGHRQPRIATLFRLCALYGCKVSTLLRDLEKELAA